MGVVNKMNKQSCLKQFELKNASDFRLWHGSGCDVATEVILKFPTKRQNASPSQRALWGKEDSEEIVVWLHETRKIVLNKLVLLLFLASL